jgi:hypothetical protein
VLAQDFCASFAVFGSSSALKIDARSGALIAASFSK